MFSSAPGAPLELSVTSGYTAAGFQFILVWSPPSPQSTAETYLLIQYFVEWTAVGEDDKNSTVSRHILTIYSPWWNSIVKER